MYDVGPYDMYDIGETYICTYTHIYQCIYCTEWGKKKQYPGDTVYVALLPAKATIFLSQNDNPHFSYNESHIGL